MTGQPTPYDVGLAEVTAGRRTLFKLGGAGLVFSTAAGIGADPAAAAGGGRTLRRTKKRAYVLVVDGCIPEEIDSGLTPNLHRLRSGGYRYSRASSKPIMETIPNHVMMMTGVRPDRSGVPANSIYDRSEKVVRDLDRPSDLRADTIIERLNRRGLRTGTVLSKEYLYGIFGTRATDRWEPAPIIPVSEHAPDVFTMEAALAMLDDLDPHLMFVNLGDIDRAGHSDVTGPLGIKAARRAALALTDAQVGRFVDALRSSGRWEHSMVIVLDDHSMDWSRPADVI
ncbi:MAG: alkaline phosphatase family protein, partial [Nocardioides sp.]